MSIPSGEVSLESALANVPAQFRSRLISAFKELKKDNRESRFELCGIHAGKFCEITLRLLQHALTKSFTPFGKQIQNFADECRILIKLPKEAGLESQRVVIPRAIVYLYTLRNKRGIGHVGGDVEANKFDSSTITKVADWIMCELVRIYHGLSLEEAESIIESLSTKEVPDVWEIAGKKRVLRNDLDAKDKVLYLLYSSQETGILFEDLVSWVKYSNSAVFKKAVLSVLDKANLVEFDRDTDTIFISPLGIKRVEDSILKTTLSI